MRSLGRIGSVAVVLLALVCLATPLTAQDCTNCIVTQGVDENGYPVNNAECAMSFSPGAPWLLNCRPRPDCTDCIGDACPVTEGGGSGTPPPYDPFANIADCTKIGGTLVYRVDAQYSEPFWECIYPWV